MSAKARLQRGLALATVGIPTVGVVAAIAIATQRGVGWLELALLVGMYVPTALGVEAGFHRFFSHRSFKAGWAVKVALGIVGSMAAQGPVIFWAAIHRKHHAFTDKEGDPHSPTTTETGFWGRLRGLWHAHVGWLFKVDDTDWNRYTMDLIRDGAIFRINLYYPVWVILGLLIPAAVGGGVTRSWEGAGLGFLWGGLVRIALLDHVTWAVNSLGHMFGRQPHESGDQSRNMLWLAMLSMGGSWHNNHHAFPGSARNDHRPWQVDLSGLFIESLAQVGLASDVRRASPIIQRQRRHEPLSE